MNANCLPRRWVGLGVMLTVLISGCDDGVDFNTNRKAEEKIRLATDIVRMWQNGVWAKSIPNLKPEQARKALDEVMSSPAKAELKKEAQRLLNEMNQKPHYYSWAARVTDFLPVLEQCQTPKLVNGPSDTLGKLPAGKFFAFSRKMDGHGPTDPDQPKEVFFDAGMIEACGDKLALAPTEVGVVIAVESEREVVGQYEVTGMTIGDTKVDFAPRGTPKKRGYNPPERYVTGSAYQEMCMVSVQAWPSRAMITLKLLGAIDPAQTGGGERTPMASEQIQTKLNDFVKRLAAGTIDPPGPE